ncbi:aspartyl aminopeptidase [Austwickia chelonae]|uniref:M18 family aminopeptidase n=1 Tax=Austwickia chelonae NBRC 105200 TaxID=1184607 RepID=K6VP83_9MICO|nr:M18 family aminopeptidase [Austwickia chelonae]GAB78504.1 peptidase M18 family protein [Austwickia chelonae NBRC 105200]SEW40212.1 aspartyl aminopeptidase [Austwickia chelonae]
MEFTVDTESAGLCRFIDASPSPFHAVDTVRSLLVDAGFVALDESGRWPDAPGNYLAVREGSLIAWSTAHLDAADGTQGHVPFRVVGGHTDSPNLRIAPRPDLSRLGWDQLGVEVYGGPLLNSWLDRDLGLSGRLLVRDTTTDRGVRDLLWRTDEPMLRVPQLAIHLDRGATSDGLVLNPQYHLTPVWGATGEAPSFHQWLAEQAQVEADDLLGWDVMTHDLTPSRRIGRTGDLIAAPRIDNLGSCYAGTRALIDTVERIAAGRTGATAGRPYVPVLVLFDHEEIGSVTNRGGDSQFLPALLERITLTLGGDRQDFLRALSGSVICSADMAHAVHPNYADRSEPQHQLWVGQGPAVKINARGRYATDAAGVACLRLAAEQAEVRLQSFISRKDMPCGSTIGPVSASLTGAVTVDVGTPMLSMHSARELVGAADITDYVSLLAAFMAPHSFSV